MAFGPSSNYASGPQTYGFLAFGATKTVTATVATSTVSLSLYLTTDPPAPEVMIWNLGAVAVYVGFSGGSTIATASTTIGMPIPANTQCLAGGRDMAIFRTNRQQFMYVISAGTATIYITPGEGRN